MFILYDHQIIGYFFNGPSKDRTRPAIDVDLFVSEFFQLLFHIFLTILADLGIFDLLPDELVKLT